MGIGIGVGGGVVRVPVVGLAAQVRVCVLVRLCVGVRVLGVRMRGRVRGRV